MTRIAESALFDAAIQHHRAGDLEEAERLCRQIVADDPRHGAALHRLGMIAYQRGQREIAAEWLTAAIDVSPDEVEIRANRSIVFANLGQLENAIADCDAVLSVRPNDPEAHCNRGFGLHRLGRHEEALAAFDQAIHFSPGFAGAYFNRGVALQALDRFDSALRAYSAAICIRPDYAEPYCNRADLSHRFGHMMGAINDATIALRLRPDFPEAHFSMGNSLRELNRLGEASACFEAALRCRPSYSEAGTNLGVILAELGRPAEALAAFDAALRFRPELSETHTNRGNALRDLGRVDEAREAYEAAIERGPDLAEAHSNRGAVLQDLGDLEDAIDAFDTAIRHRPDLAEAHSNRLMVMHYAETPGEVILEAARKFGTQFDREGVRPGVAGSPDPERRLRVGYVSGDFCRHPVGYFIAAILPRHDRSQVEIFCYETHMRQDDLAETLRASADHWRSLVGLSDEEAAARIGEDGIDVLVDLSGHTAHNRLPMFALKPAPVQVTWLGFWGTTGLSAMDYILSDEMTIPKSEEGWYSERVMRLAPSRFCYAPPDYAPAPKLPEGPVIFGSFNNLAKVGPKVVRLWAAVLRAAPGSKLSLKWKTLGDGRMRKRVAESFAAEGIAAERLILRGPSRHEEMLGEYGEVDVALDPFPFSGGLTSCEALWMGVPVVTLPGSGAPSRQTLGFLTLLGHEDWAAKDEDDYVRIAAGLAADRANLAELRQSLRPRMAASPLCDGSAFTRGLEQAYRTMWKGLSMKERVFLHVGCGPLGKEQTTKEFALAGWKELRYDIDPKANPDIIGTMTDMSAVPSESVDAVYSSHNIEHLYAHEVPVALGEFLRVLREDGFLVITCPDLQSVARLIAEDKLVDPAYMSPAGPITPLDILYGHRPQLAAGNHYMAHRCGFTRRVLDATLFAAGFQSVATMSREGPDFDLWAVATKTAMSESALRELAQRHFPDVAAR